MWAASSNNWWSSCGSLIHCYWRQWLQCRAQQFYCASFLSPKQIFLWWKRQSCGTNSNTVRALPDAAVSDSLHLSLGIPFKRARFPGLGTAKMHHRQLSNYLMHVCHELRNSQRPREKITTLLCMYDSVNVTQAIQTCPPLKMLHKC